MRITFLLLLALFVGVACSQIQKPEKHKTAEASKDSAESKPAVTLNTSDGTAEIQIPAEKKEIMLPPPGPANDIIETNIPPEDKEDTLLDLRRARTAFNNGIQYYKSGELEKAIDAFKTALSHKPDNDKAFYNLGKIYYELGQKDLALSFYEDAFHHNPDDSASATAAGLIYFERGNYSKAMQRYNEALAVAPSYGLAYYNRGTLFGQQKRYNEALQDLTNAIRFDPENANAFMNRGLAFFYIKQRDRACKDWERAAMMGLENAQKAVDLYCKENFGNQ